MFIIEIKRQVIEVVQFLINDTIQEKAYKSVLDNGGEVVSRDSAPHIIKVKKIRCAP